ncbi:hypothetical protein M427DRAFT_146773 [Gonapodya prolifera JEL478]|uniref:C3H1-type domain-containing protein n=1 Tax=Gonapodya prolifera (strain JEL478) TaxID=1344416 RepID=A0A139A9D9_GONPJ|nr:hypothetical protein M427DRAFT_146773 [Gonapodya prolifera JEL478]|eukprot:KXS13013.1 hypothetical protein M427DRAFT_146773 [Gonapodya prolifera JEL478]
MPKFWFMVVCTRLRRSIWGRSVKWQPQMERRTHARAPEEYQSHTPSKASEGIWTHTPTTTGMYGFPEEPEVDLPHPEQPLRLSAVCIYFLGGQCSYKGSGTCRYGSHPILSSAARRKLLEQALLPSNPQRKKRRHLPSPSQHMDRDDAVFLQNQLDTAMGEINGICSNLGHMSGQHSSLQQQIANITTILLKLDRRVADIHHATCSKRSAPPTRARPATPQDDNGSSGPGSWPFLDSGHGEYEPRDD